MLRNWYAVYTKPQKEKFVSSNFTKKGFECFCPVINTVKGKNSNKKVAFEPLFLSHVFVHMSEADVSVARSIPGVVNVLFWKSKPAIIKKEEIEAIRQLSESFVNIKLVKTTVDMNSNLRVKDEPVLSFNDKLLSIKHQAVKMNLPSLGYIIIAERKVAEDEPVLQEESLLKAFPKRINSFFFN